MTNKIGIYQDPRNKNRPWVVRWYGEYDPNTGKKRRYSKSFKLKRDAEAFVAEQAMKFKNGQRRDKADEIALEVFCKDWLKIKKPELRPMSLDLYNNTLARLLDYFGPNLSISQITPHKAAKFMAELKPVRGQTISAWTKHRVLRNCKTMFQTAIDWELISKNPFANTKAPKCITKQWYYLKPNEYRKLLNVAPRLGVKAFYALTYTAGLRLGEALSLTWNNIDFEAGEVRIENRPATTTLPPFYIKDSEARRIPLPEHTLDILTKLQKEASERVPYVLFDETHYWTMVAKWRRFQKEKKAWRSQNIVNNVLRNFKQHLKQADIKPEGTLTVHTLRKCCCKNWIVSGIPMDVVKSLMGHSSIVTTQKFYSQVSDADRAKAAQVIDELLKKTDVKLTYEDNLDENKSDVNI